LKPVAHALRYEVFTLHADLDALPELDQRLRLFSLKRFNLVSFHPADHGGVRRDPAHRRDDPRAELLALKQRILAAADEALGAGIAERVEILCYPRILGYAFNPLTTYYVYDASGALRLMVYEVNNTFGERHTYVLPVEHDAPGILAQATRKVFFVSPFNRVEGRYGFRVTQPLDEVTIGVSLKTADGPVLKAHFRGKRQTFDDKNLLAACLRMPLMTLKVMAGIHVEALRLWLKGLKIVRRPRPPAEPFSIQTRRG
jgi:DUF1365 family protein